MILKCVYGVLLCFIGFGGASVLAFQASYADSLKLHLQQLTDPKEKLKHYEKLCNSLQLTNPHKCIKYALEAVAVARENKLDLQEARFLDFAGNAAYYISAYAQGLEYHFQALEIRERLGTLKEKSQSYNNIGIIFQYQENFNKAIEYFERALSINEELKDCDRATNLNNLAWCYDQADRDSLADAFYREAINVSLACNDEGTLAYTYNGLGILLYEAKKFPEALFYFKNSLELALKQEDFFIQCWDYNYLSSIHRDLGLHQESQQFAETALKLSEKLGDQTMIEKAFWNLYKNAEVRNNPKQALAYLERYLATHDKLFALKKEKQLWTLQYEKEAEKRAELGIALANEQGKNSRLHDRLNALLLLLVGVIALALYASFLYFREKGKRKEGAQLYEAKKDELHQQQEELHMQNESISQQKEMLETQNEEIRNQRRQLMRQHAELAQSQAQLEKVNNQLKEAHREMGKLAKEQGKQLNVAKEELDMFTNRAALDFKGPLSSLRGLAYTGRKISTSVDSTRLFKEVEITAEKMENMFNKLMTVYYINHHVVCNVETSFKAIFDLCRQDLKGSLAEAHYQFEVLGQLSGNTIYTDPRLWKQALLAIWENALQHSGKKENLEIKVDPQVKNGQLIIRFSDNGSGIAEEIIDRACEMYFRGSDKSGGNGLGLYIAKKAMEQLSGSVSLENDNGCVATLTAPVTLR